MNSGLVEETNDLMKLAADLSTWNQIEKVNIEEYVLDMVLIDYIYLGMEKGEHRDNLIASIKSIEPTFKFTTKSDDFSNVANSC